MIFRDCQGSTFDAGQQSRLGGDPHYRVTAINSADAAGTSSEPAHARTPDILPPEPVSARVPASGAQLVIDFDDTLADAAGQTPRKEQFTVLLDDEPAKIGAVVVRGSRYRVLLNGLDPVVRAGQVVKVTYDPPPEVRSAFVERNGKMVCQSAALQDGDCNAARNFTLGPGAAVAVDSDSTQMPGAPGAPATLTAMVRTLQSYICFVRAPSRWPEAGPRSASCCSPPRFPARQG